MKTFLSTVVALFAFTSTGWAAPKTVTLLVSKMTCATCPITVKKALTKVKGVTEVRVDFDRKEAAVAFDDAQTDAATLIKATTDAGYPSTLKQPTRK